MADIWLVSDTHFNHTNILKFKDKSGAHFRGDVFKDVDHMNETMIENWNRVVKDGDKVYHLGDVYMTMGEKAHGILQRLKGKKRLILGNHDKGKDTLLHKFFQNIYMWRIFDGEVLLSHVPVHPGSIRGSYNVHGHIHQNPSPDGPYMNVCVEQTGWTPVNYETVRDKLRRM